MILLTNPTSTLLKPIGLIFIAVALSACNQKEDQQLEDYLKSVTSRAAKPITPIPAIKPYLRFVYPEHDIDPFDITVLAPVVSAASGPERQDNGITIDTTRVPEFLEGFPLSSLTMVGTVNKKGEVWALVKTPKGGVQRVKEGNYLGENYGQIKEISDTKISLNEIIPNGYGGYKPRETAINLFSN